jgi:hypothetical protein
VSAIAHDPLIAEARERARRRRVLALLVVGRRGHDIRNARRRTDAAAASPGARMSK